MDSTRVRSRAVPERLGIAGSGTIGRGFAVLAARHGRDVVMWARSEESRVLAESDIERGLAKHAMGRRGEVTVTNDLGDLGDRTFVVEAIREDPVVKAVLYRDLQLPEDAVLATTTSSLSVSTLATASGRPDRFLALHVFNPVHRMPLVELAFPEVATETTRDRARILCETFGKTAIEVPDTPGFVVNRLLFPFLFEAVRVMETTHLTAEDVDDCMKLGAGHPMGPLELLDFVGLDVAIAIGESIGLAPPRVMDRLVSEGAMGRKSGRGFYEY
jgi:3-hydroxybutyryl-CoA dehydrogenase